MNKNELISAVAESADITKKDAGKAIEGLVSVISKHLSNPGRDVQIRGFGTFRSVYTPARHGTNPQTGAPMTIAARNSVKFKVAKSLSEAVNG